MVYEGSSIKRRRILYKQFNATLPVVKIQVEVGEKRLLQ